MSAFRTAGPAAGRSLIAGLAIAAGCSRSPSRPPPPPLVTAQAWADVEAAGAPHLAPGPADELARALELIESKPLPDLGTPGVDREHDAEVSEQLPPEAIDAVAALVRWDQAHGRLPARACLGIARPGEPSPGPSMGATVLKTMKLARVALLVAGEDPEAPAVKAVLGLAAGYRDEGISLLEAMAGTAMADAVRRWATGLRLPPGQAMRGYRPTDDGLRRLVAAEARCSLTMYGEIRDPANQELADGIARVYHAHGAAERERALAAEEDALRGYWIAVLADLRDRDHDPAAADRRLTERAERLHRDPEHHPALAVMATPLPHLLDRMRESDASWRTWLAGP